MNAPRVLLAAYQCGPGLGSVSQIGWHWYARLARQLPVTLVTHVRNAPALRAAGAPLAGSEVIYIDTERFAGPLYRLASRLFPRSQHAVFLISSLDYYVYDRAAVRELRRRQAQGHRWDLVHAPTPVSPMAATRLHQLGLPVILGPWNGGLGSPPAFREIMGEDAGWLYPLRRLGRLMDGLTGSTRRARVILTATRATLEAIPRRDRPRCLPMLENGVDLDIFTPAPWPPPPSPEQPLQVVYVGRLVPFKGVSMLLEAAERVCRRLPLRVTLVGDGPLEADLRAETAARGLQAVVNFTGALPPAAVAAHLRAAHVFCLPSVRESGGAVLLEALASARPVIAVAFGGPAEIVDDAIGLALPPDGRAAVVAGLETALLDVAQQPDQWRQRGETGRLRAEQRYSWDAKVSAAVDLYGSLLKP